MNGSEPIEPGEGTVGQDPLLGRWHIAREIIKHEDDLYDQRLRSLLTLHGFLFASVAVVVSVATNEEHQAYSLFLFIFVLVLCWVGYRTACRAKAPLKAARHQVAVAALWWTWTAEGRNVGRCERSCCESYQSRFPPIIGGKEYYGQYNENLITASDQEENKTSKPFQPLEHFLKRVWLAMLILIFISGSAYFIFFHLDSYYRCMKPFTTTATADNMPSIGWSQHLRCFLMPRSQMPPEKSKPPG